MIGAIERNFDKKSLRALKKAQKRGVKVFYCTARPYYSVKHIGTFKYFKGDGIICCNGGMAVYKDEIVYQKTFSKDTLNKVCECVLKHNLNLECTESFTSFYIAPINEHVKDFLKVYYEPKPVVGSYKDKEIISMLLVAPREYDEILKLEFPSEISFYRFSDLGVDLFSIPHEKSTGVKTILEHLNIAKEDTLSIGDDYGDLAMFNETGIKVAMGNAKDKVKESATFVTKEVWNHGVYHALKHFNIV